VFIDVSGVVVDGVKLPSSAGEFIDDALGAGSETRVVASAGLRDCVRPGEAAPQGVARIET
jgi:hypothetical protein